MSLARFRARHDQIKGSAASLAGGRRELIRSAFDPGREKQLKKPIGRAVTLGDYAVNDPFSVDANPLKRIGRVPGTLGRHCQPFSF